MLESRNSRLQDSNTQYGDLLCTHLVEIEEQVGSVGDQQTAVGVNATLVQGLKLLEHGGHVNDNTCQQGYVI